MMTLHEDNKQFREVLEETANAQGIDIRYVEKDYWITRSLGMLAQSPYADRVVFKGGTSLTKAYQLTKRFSDDIDVAVINADELSQGRMKRGFRLWHMCSLYPLQMQLRKRLSK